MRTLVCMVLVPMNWWTNSITCINNSGKQVCEDLNLEPVVIYTCDSGTLPSVDNIYAVIPLRSQHNPSTKLGAVVESSF